MPCVGQRESHVTITVSTTQKRTYMYDQDACIVDSQNFGEMAKYYLFCNYTPGNC